MAEYITMKEAIDGILGLFEILPWENREYEKSFYSVKEDGTASFFFDKRQYTREDVIEKLCDYFNDKIITDGQCRIDAITLAWTTVHIEPRKIEKKTGAELIADERKRQIEVEGWTKEHDAEHINSELAHAAACYAYPYRGKRLDYVGWPDGWSLDWYKPTPDNRIRELVKAGALIAAEIDRIQNETNE